MPPICTRGVQGGIHAALVRPFSSAKPIAERRFSKSRQRRFSAIGLFVTDKLKSRFVAKFLSYRSASWLEKDDKNIVRTFGMNLVRVETAALRHLALKSSAPEEFAMYKLEPIALIVESDNTYLVRFKSEDGEVEYRFTANEKGFLSVGCEVPFARITNGDPAVPLLTQAVANFHQARHYRYDPAS